jgi:hypothetical protein
LLIFCTALSIPECGSNDDRTQFAHSANVPRSVGC